MSVAYYREQDAQNAMAVVAGWIGRNRKVKVVYHSGTAVDANIYTGVIRIPRMACASGVTEEALQLLRGRVYHESGHIDLTQIDKADMPRKALKLILNALEDRRIEAEEGRKHPGCASVFRWNMEYYNKKLGEGFSQHPGENPLFEAMAAMSFQVDGMRPSWTLSPKAKLYFDKAYDEFAKIRQMTSTVDTLELAKVIHEILKDAAKDWKEQEEEKNKQSEKSEDGEQGEKGQDGEQEQGEGEEGDEDGEEKQDDKGKSEKGKSKKADEKDEGEKDEEDEKGEGSGSGDDKDEDEKGEDEKDGADKDEDEKDGEGKSEGSEEDDSDNEDKGKGGSDGDDSEDDSEDEDGESEGKGKEDKDDESEDDEDGKESSSSGGVDVDDEDDGDDDDDESEAGDSSGEKSEDGKGDEEADEGAEEGSKGGRKPSKGNKGGDGKSEAEKNKEAEQALEDESDSNGMSQEEVQNKQIAESLAEIDPQDAEYLSLRDNDIHETPEIEDGDAATYKTRREDVSVMVSTMTRAMEQALRSMAKCRRKPYMENGRIDRKRLVTIAKGLSKDVFYKVRKGATLDVAVEIIIDESGSMNQYYNVQLLAMAIGEALNAIGVPFEITGTTTKFMQGRGVPALDTFSRTNPMVYQHYKTFGERWATVRSRIIHTGMHSHNIDGEAVEYAAFRLGQRRESRKVIFSLSDGNPCGGHGEENDALLGENLSRVCKRVRKQGTEVYGFGISTDKPMKYYGKEWFMYMNSVADAGPEFVKKFVQIVTQGRVKI